MKQAQNIQKILAQLQAREGAAFQADEEAIALEYQKINANRSGIAIKVLTVFGGILASLTFIAFLVIAGLMDSDAGMLTLGLAFIIASVWLGKAYDKLIIDTTAVSLFVIGLVVLTFGLEELKVHDSIVCIILLLIAMITLAIIQNYMPAFIAVLVVNGSIIALVLDNNTNLIHIYLVIAVIILTLLMLDEAGLITSGKKVSLLYNPVRLGLIVSILVTYIMIAWKGWFPHSIHFNLVSAVAAIAAILYTLPRIMVRLDVQSATARAGVYLVTALLLVPTLYAPAIPGALLLTLLSFWVNYKTGFALGIIALVYFIGQYYYDLQFTLLTKSLLMMASGILFLLLCLLTHKKLNPHEKI